MKADRRTLLSRTLPQVQRTKEAVNDMARVSDKLADILDDVAVVLRTDAWDEKEKLKHIERLVGDAHRYVDRVMRGG